jgi:peptidoglycan/xylan/chitin deacetylase (PgdA/CDA1 family)
MIYLKIKILAIRMYRYICGFLAFRELEKVYPGCMVAIKKCNFDYPEHLIVTYHKIGHKYCDRYGLNVGQDNFTAHIKWLKSNYDVVTIEEQQELVSIKNAKSVVITFDDCYNVSFSNVIQILQDNHIPAIFYVSTMSFDDETTFMWNDALDELLFCIGNEVKIRDLLNYFNINMPSIEKLTYKDIKDYESWNFHSLVNYPHQRFFIAKLLRNEFLHINSVKKYQEAIQFLKYFGLHSEFKLLSRKSIEGVKDKPLVIIGGHTHDHLNLSMLSLCEKESQIGRNKLLLEAALGRSINHFAYPYGGKRFIDLDTIKTLEKFKYSSAVTTLPGCISLDINSFLLPRFGIRDIKEIAGQFKWR